MATTTTKTTTSATLTTTTVKASEAAYSDLSEGSYSVSGTPTTGTIQARLLCSPAGSTKYYADSRDAKGMLTIDMTKEINMT